MLVSDALITHANPRYTRDVADSAVPEFVDEMARSPREGPIFATVDERGADADEEKSPLNVPRKLARTPNRFQPSVYLRGFCNWSYHILENTKAISITHDFNQIEEFMYSLHLLLSYEDLGQFALIN